MSVRDGGSTEAPLVGRFCGHNLPQNFLSTGNQLLIRFKTDSSISQEGFRASYRTGIMSLDIKNHVLCINDIVITVLEIHSKVTLSKIASEAKPKKWRENSNFVQEKRDFLSDFRTLFDMFKLSMSC